MVENFHDAQKVKSKRGNSFMGGVKEVRKAPRPTPQAEPLVVEAPKPLPTRQEPVVKAESSASAEVERAPLTKGYKVGYTSEGIVRLEAFGGLSELELVGLVEYSKTKIGQLLDRIAKTDISQLPALKQGVIVLAEGINSLLRQKHEEIKAAS